VVFIRVYHRPNLASTNIGCWQAVMLKKIYNRFVNVKATAKSALFAGGAAGFVYPFIEVAINFGLESAYPKYSMYNF